MTFSSSVAKVGLYLSATPVQENDVTVEQRLVNVRLTMPTVAFVEMCVSALMSIKSNSTLIEQALNEQTNKIMSSLEVVRSSRGEEKTE